MKKKNIMQFILIIYLLEFISIFTNLNKKNFLFFIFINKILIKPKYM